MIEEDRLVAAAPKEREAKQDRAIRPKSLAEYVGQPVVREQMEIFIEAAKKREETRHRLLKNLHKIAPQTDARQVKPRRLAGLHASTFMDTQALANTDLAYRCVSIQRHHPTPSPSYTHTHLRHARTQRKPCVI